MASSLLAIFHNEHSLEVFKKISNARGIVYEVFCHKLPWFVAVLPENERYLKCDGPV